MKSTELRVGNLVKESISGVVGMVDLFILNILEDNPNHSYEYEPLTEDWLIKFGFTKHIEEIVVGSADIYYTLSNPCWTLRKNGDNWDVKFWQGCDLLYVHQLQNLYQALTGEELTILKEKENTPT